jgi:hypothetical protein
VGHLVITARWQHIVKETEHIYDIRPRKDRRGFDLISDVLPFGALWYGEPDAISNAVNYAKFYSRSDDAVIRVYDEAGNVIERTSTLAISASSKVTTMATARPCASDH